jgi:acyl-homoserine lactone acylase PvdQ
MLNCVKAGHKGRDLGKAIHIFDNWNFKFDVESSAASLFSVWESKIVENLHETTVPSIDMRRSFGNHPTYASSVFLQIKNWARSKETHEVQCRLFDL